MRERESVPGRSSSVEAEPTSAGTVGKATLSQTIEQGEGDGLIGDVRRAALAGHSGRALKLMSTASAVEQARIAHQLGDDARRAFAKHMPHSVGDSEARRETIKALFDGTPDSEVATLELLVEARFVLHVGGNPKIDELGPGKKWDAAGLRRMWTVLEVLPPEHVAHNWAVARLERYKDTDDKDPRHAHGYAYTNELGISYRPDIIEDGGTTDHDQAGDPLHGVNRFDEVARHEVGHAVDRELGQVSDRILTKTAEAGHWKIYWGPAEWRQAAQDMLRRSGGPWHRLSGGDRERVLDAMVHAMETSSVSKFNHVIEQIEGHRELELDPVYKIMNDGMAKDDPWKTGGPALDGRHFHQTYKGGTWASYDVAAFKNHRVSEYQFRAPGEWFAEAYAAFYTPGEEGAPKGSRLLDKCPHTHAWFTANVDNKKAVERRGEHARKAAHEPRKK